jgi:hypothetical protein
LKSEPDADRAVRALIEWQRELANSPYLAMRFRTLWVAALLDKRLKQCTDHEVGELMVIVQGRFHVFESEFGICEHARKRLVRSTGKDLQ